MFRQCGKGGHNGPSGHLCAPKCPISWSAARRIPATAGGIRGPGKGVSPSLRQENFEKSTFRVAFLEAIFVIFSSQKSAKEEMISILQRWYSYIEYKGPKNNETYKITVSSSGDLARKFCKDNIS